MENGNQEVQYIGKHVVRQGIMEYVRLGKPIMLLTPNCGLPPPPTGFIFPYSGTIDGAVVNFICQNSALCRERNVTICNKQGK